MKFQFVFLFSGSTKVMEMATRDRLHMSILHQSRGKISYCMYRKMSLTPIHLSQKNSLKMSTCEKCTMCENGHMLSGLIKTLEKKEPVIIRRLDYEILEFKANITQV